MYIMYIDYRHIYIFNIYNIVYLIYIYIYIYIINTHIHIHIGIQVTLNIRPTFYSYFKEFFSDKYYIYVHIYKLYIIKSLHDSKIRKICNASVSKAALSIVNVWSQATGTKQLLYWLVYIYILCIIYYNYILYIYHLYIYLCALYA